MSEPLITNRIINKEPAKVVAKANLPDTDKKGWAKVMSAVVKTDPKTVANKVLYEVVIPSTLQMIMKSVNTGMSTFFGIDIPQAITNAVSAQSNMPRINYSAIGTQTMTLAQPTPQDAGYTGLSVYNKLTWDFKKDADDILQSMADYLSEYEKISVGKMCEFAGIRNVTTDYNFGWTDLRSARVIELANGKWSLFLPAVQPLN